MIRLEGISKRFGDCQALSNASMDLYPGQVVAVLGENGAGKSTLMRILAGHIQPDEGKLLLSGQEVRFRNPRQALASGIGLMQQHSALVPTLSAIDNVVLGREPRRAFGLLDRSEARAQVERLRDRLGFEADLDVPVASLPVGVRQKIELLRILHAGARFVILDEPTAVLSAPETEALFELLRSLACDGCAIAFVTHKMSEFRAVSDRLVMMRAGHTVFEAVTAETSEPELAGHLLGARPTPVTNADRPRRPINARSTPVLALRGIWTGPEALADHLHGASLTVHAGEVLGIAGVEGNGQGALVELLSGLSPPTQGALQWRGGRIERFGPEAMRALRIRCIPEDRQAYALVGPMSLEENLALGRETRSPFARWGLIDRKGRRRFAELAISRLEISPTSPTTAAAHLSGGNQQKLVLGRALDDGPALLVLHQPTRGLDLVASARLRQTLGEAVDGGMAAIWIASDLDELLEVSDRLMVIHRGQLSPPMLRGQVDLGAIGRRMMGMS